MTDARDTEAEAEVHALRTALFDACALACYGCREEEPIEATDADHFVHTSAGRMRVRCEASEYQRVLRRDYQARKNSGPDLDLLATFAAGTGGRRTGALMRAGFIRVEITSAGFEALAKAGK
jgi:hypothetical protein